MIAIQLLLHLLLPAIFLIWLAAGRPVSRLHWLGLAGIATGFIGFIVVVGAWAWVGYPLRILMLGLLLTALVVSYRRARSLPWRTALSWTARLDLGFRFAMALLFAGLAAWGLAGYRVTEESVTLAFPLRDQVYVIGQGGATPLINQHNLHPSQKYALDIVGLAGIGVRARGVYPSRLDRYAIYGDSVFSPCAGSVVRAVDGLEDYDPPGRDRERPAGNSVVLECSGYVIYLAHLQKGSVRVETGDEAEVGQPLGLVGNSGNTTEPHLHIHTERGPYTGEGKPGVPMRFGGRFLVRNSIIW